MGGRLILVPTPIGNLEDITLRALRVLREADRIAAEDTRRTGRLLAHYEIKKPMMSFHEHNEARQSAHLVELMEAGETVALVSDAGTPGISDPGFRAVRAAREAGLPVEVLPGATALVPALVVSGLASDRFIFEGFMPRKSGARRRLFESLTDEKRSVIFYESPYRAAKSMAELAGVHPLRPVALIREISKLHEEVLRGSAAELAERLAAKPPKGELVLIIGPPA